MTIVESGFEKLSYLYSELVNRTLLLHGVREIRCENESEHFFDRIRVNEDDTISVYKYGLREPFSGLNFDHTVDYATCLAYIEHDIYLAQRKGKPERGMIIIFREERRESNKAV